MFLIILLTMFAERFRPTTRLNNSLKCTKKNVSCYATVASFQLLCCSIWFIFFRLFLAAGCFPFVVSGKDYISARMALIRIFRFWQGRVFFRFSLALNDVFSSLHQGSLLHRRVFSSFFESGRRICCTTFLDGWITRDWSSCSNSRCQSTVQSLLVRSSKLRSSFCCSCIFWCCCRRVGYAWNGATSDSNFFYHNFGVESYVPREPRRDPSNRRLSEHGIYIRRCQESNSQPVPS